MSGIASNRWVIGARVKTLPAAVVPVLVGTALAWRVPPGVVPKNSCSSCVMSVDMSRTSWGGIDWINAVLALVVAVLLQVATNYANDYSDGKRGTDNVGLRIGPPRMVGNGLATVDEVKAATFATFGLAGIAGLVLCLRSEPWLVVIGVACVLAGYFYTGGSQPYGYLGFGEVSVFIFFGLVATTGSTFVQLRTVPWQSVLAGLMLGCLSMALLMVNNIRDIPGDTKSNKMTLAVRLGSANARRAYVSMMAAPFLLLPIFAGIGDRPVASIAFVALVLATQPAVATLHGAAGLNLLPVLARTARVQLVFGVLLAIGSVLSVELLVG